MTQGYDCIVAGSCVADILCKPVDLTEPIGAGLVKYTEPIVLTGGGITGNAGITMARLGLRVGVLSYVGDDEWGAMIRGLLRREGVDDALLTVHPTGATSATVVAIDPTGERSFLHYAGAPRQINAGTILDRIDAFRGRGARFLLLGYYTFLGVLEPDLARVLKAVRETGCKTALDTAGDGGTMTPLAECLPHLDVYVPSLGEAQHQTGLEEPREMIEVYRKCGAPGILGVKLGKRGAILSPRAGEFIEIPAVAPPGPVVDMTGAGDSFYAGLVAGLVKGLSVEQAGKMGAACGACCVTAMGGSTGGRGWEETARMAGVKNF